MDEMKDMLESMGGFADAFGMSDLTFSEFIGYFAAEFSETVLLGGAHENRHIKSRGCTDGSALALSAEAIEYNRKDIK